MAARLHRFPTRAAVLLAPIVFVAAACRGREPGAGAVAVPPAAATPAVRDPIRSLQAEAETIGRAAWGHWGDTPERYVTWSTHSNRLVPVYSFGMTLASVSGANSVYRSEEGLRALYGRLPDDTLDPDAGYFDQTDVCRLQLEAAAAGKKMIVLFVFDGLDWHTTRVAAIAARGRVEYSAGRGTGLTFQDYRGAPTDFGFCVTSPANASSQVDVDAQVVTSPDGAAAGGYDPRRGGATPWDPRADARYLTGRDRDRPHAFTDSAASATSLCAGRKTYNVAINVGVDGEQLEPVARRLQREGWGVGVVTSVPVSHATPACAYANNVKRDDYQDISRDLLGVPSVAHRGTPLPGVDVLLGAGHGVRAEDDVKDQGRNFEPGNKYVAESTLAAIDVAAGGRYRVATRTAGRSGAELLAEAAADARQRKLRLFGFFGTVQGNLPFRTADGRFDPDGGLPPGDTAEVDALRKKYGSAIHYEPADLAENPTLADMTRTALDVLAERGDRFWLMVEAGDVDWASHANNIDTCIGAVHSGDAAFRTLVEWIEARDAWDDAVVIVTSDHGHMFVLTDPAAFAVR